MSYNRVTLVGRLGARPETTTTASDVKIANFSLATNKRIKGEDKTEWHRVVAFNKTAELVSTYLDKGSQCLVEGEIQTRQWDDKEGNKRYTTEVVANRVVFIGSKADAQAAATTTNQSEVHPGVENHAPTFDADESLPF